MVQMTLVGPMFGQYVHFMRFAPKGNDYALDRYRTQVRRVLATFEERLGVVEGILVQEEGLRVRGEAKVEAVGVLKRGSVDGPRP